MTQIAALRMIDLTDAGDRLIAFRPPAHVLRHPHKMVWFIHHIRAYYDLWDGDFGPEQTPAARALRAALHRVDTTTLGEARKVFTNSQIVADRLAAFNGIAATPLYPPILDPGRFCAGPYGEEIVAVCRMEPHKRQHLLVEAMAHTRTPVVLRLCGRTSGEAYAQTPGGPPPPRRRRDASSWTIAGFPRPEKVRTGWRAPWRSPTCRTMRIPTAIPPSRRRTRKRR